MRRTLRNRRYRTSVMDYIIRILGGCIIFLIGIIGIMAFRTWASEHGAGVSLLEKIGITEKSSSREWNLTLVNASNPISDNYQIKLIELSNGQQVDERIYPYLQQMFDDARAEGLSLFVRAGYRTNEEQQQIMDDKIADYEAQGCSEKEAKKLAETYVAVPGTSEHQLGLSVDINASDNVSSDQVYKWLDENAWKYGFIKRYPADKTDITGISDEPWHYRYVGKEAAREMKDKNLCLEEYLKEE